MRELQERINELVSLYTYSSPLLDNEAVSIEYLLDAIVCLFYECKLPQHLSERNCNKYYTSVKRYVEKIVNCWISRSEFETIRLIGSGAFGDVSVVRWKTNGQIYALKSLHKYDMLKRSDYFLMDFYNGGDMLTMLTKFDDKIPENIVQFYVAEMVLAIDALHQLGYVHRDIKPDNILLDSSGHIVLADFGSCLKIGENGLVRNSTAVGTPDYISPEILRASEDNHGNYGTECDYWSLGVVMYEMLFGETPFYSETLIETYSHIMNFEKHFVIPKDCIVVSELAQDLMKRLICDRKHRLGRNGVRELKEHLFFKDMDWEHIRDQNAPYIPEVTSPDDTSNFDTELSARNHEGPPLGTIFRGCQVACIGFTFTNTSPLNEMGWRYYNTGKCKCNKGMTNLVGHLSHVKLSSDEQLNETDVKQLTDRCEAYEKKIVELETRTSCLSFEGTNQLPNELTNGNDLSHQDQQQHLNTTIDYLNKQLDDLKNRFDLTQIDNNKHVDTIDYLKTELIEQSDTRQKMEIEVTTLEEENELLCKRAADAQDVIRQMESERKELLSDLAKLRLELAQSKDLASQTAHAADSTAASGVVVNGTAKSQNLSSSSSNSLSSISIPTAVDRPRNGKRRDDDVNDESTTPIVDQLALAKRECQQWQCKFETEQDQWIRERELIDSKIQMAVKNRTSELEAELSQVRSSHAELESNIANWEHHLFELNQWVDDEKEAKEKLHLFTVHLLKEVETLRLSHSRSDNSYQSVVDVSSQHPTNNYCPTIPSIGACPSANDTSVYDDSHSTGGVDWRQRKSTKINKMERWNLEVALNNEVRAREVTELKLQELEAKCKDLTELSKQKDAKMDEQDQMIEQLNDQLLSLSSRSQFDQIDKNHMTSTPNHSLNTNRPDCSSNPTDDSSAAHEFILSSFAKPTKCHVCGCLILGQKWQGVQCQNCQLRCHSQCRTGAGTICCLTGLFSPTTQPQVAKANGRTRGFSTEYESLVRIPKVGGIKRGWLRNYVFMSDMRLFFYDVTVDSNANNLPGVNANNNNSGSFTSLGPSSSVIYRPSVHSSTNDPSSNNVIAFDSVSPNRIIDLRIAGFSIARVTDADVIHAKVHDIPKIVKIALEEGTLSRSPLFLLFESPVICERWIKIIQDALKIDKRNVPSSIPDNRCLQMHELYNSSLPIVKQILSACVLDEYRFLAGTEEGLFVVDTKHNIFTRIGSKKPIYQVEALAEELQLVVVIQGKQRNLKLILSGTIEGMNLKPIKVTDPKVCVKFICFMSPVPSSTTNTTNNSSSNSNSSSSNNNNNNNNSSTIKSTVCLLCVAAQRSVWVYEIARIQGRHKRLKEIPCPGPVQALNDVRNGEWICIGCPNYFGLYNLWKDTPAVQVLLRADLIDLDPSLAFLQHGTQDAHLAIQLGNDEFLLAFDICGVYLNSRRQRTRSEHLMWPAKLISGTAFAYSHPYLYVFTEAGLIVYQVELGTWIGTYGLCQAKPLNHDTHLCLVHTQHHAASLSSSAGTHLTSTARKSLSSLNGPNLSQSSLMLHDDSGGSHHQQQQQQSLHLVYLPYSNESSTSTSQGSSGAVNGALRIRRLEPMCSPVPFGNVRMRRSSRFPFQFSKDDKRFTSPDRLILNFRSGRYSRPTSKSRNSQLTNAQSASQSSLAANATVDRRSQLISTPSDFRHVGHLGPQLTGTLVDLGPVSSGRPPPTEAELVMRYKSAVERKYRVYSKTDDPANPTESNTTGDYRSVIDHQTAVNKNNCNHNRNVSYTGSSSSSGSSGGATGDNTKLSNGQPSVSNGKQQQQQKQFVMPIDQFHPLLSAHRLSLNDEAESFYSNRPSFNHCHSQAHPPPPPLPAQQMSPNCNRPRAQSTSLRPNLKHMFFDFDYSKMNNESNFSNTNHHHPRDDDVDSIFTPRNDAFDLNCTAVNDSNHSTPFPPITTSNSPTIQESVLALFSRLNSKDDSHSP